ncbi:hypothetical protein JB92DRAFT_3066621 [Gautieria morchelliformis]|nr:hypothetical protein JB92DRAFT_3066621 [Gautieria morchelliformis]
MAVARPSSALMPCLHPKPSSHTRGAVILHEESPETRDSRGIYLPNYIEPPSSSPGTDGCSEDVSRHLLRSGALTPLALNPVRHRWNQGCPQACQMTLKHFPEDHSISSDLRRRILKTVSLHPLTHHSLCDEKRKIMLRGGAHRFHELFSEELGSNVSIIKVTGGTFERVSGTSLGGGTLWGLLSLLTPATSFDEGRGGQRRKFSAEDISRSLLYAISNNIGQIAKVCLDKIYFGGCFIRGYDCHYLSYAIRFWSKGTKRALFLRHEGFLGSIGAWIKNIEVQDVDQRINGR